MTLATGIRTAPFPPFAPSRRWIVEPVQPCARALGEKLHVSVVAAQILLSRGLGGDLERLGDCEAFLRPSLKLLHDPEALPGLTRAAERIARAVREHELIVVYGDYDVDGITATSILYHALKGLGGVVRTYIPHRVEEGYGLNAGAMTALCDEGAKLIVTVDCGITALIPAQVVAARGVDLIITDHHEWKVDEGGNAVLPVAHAVVHPRVGAGDKKGCDPVYANPHLCGAGVAFKVAWGVGKAMLGERVGVVFRELLVEMTALCALGTIADVVPLVGENRVIASFGLKCLPQSKLTGILALIESANLGGESLDAYHVGFLLAPRLNAAGRMGHAGLALEMLTTADVPRATEIATYLEQQNKERQAVERETLAMALEEAARNGDDGEGSHAVVVAGKGWHPGVIGIVASRIVDRLCRPAIVLSVGDEHAAGSGRSIGGYHLAKALGACSDLLISHGGHEMAAGLKVSPGYIEAFRERIRAHAKREIAPEQLVPSLRIDAEVSLGQVTAALVGDLARLGPFGHANRKPVLAARGVEVALPPRRVGKAGEHLQLTMRQGGATVKGIAFKMGDLAEGLSVGDRIDMAFEPGLNVWNGRTSVEVVVKDVRCA